MRGTRVLSIGLFAALILAITPVSVSATYKLGQSCKKGQTAVITMPVNIRVSLTCTKVGSTWKFTNSDGALHVTKYIVPVGVSQKPYQMYMPVLGGKPPYKCILEKGSTLPTGFTYSYAGQVINGVWNCVIAAGAVPTLSVGTTKTISPPFTMVFSDASSPIQKATLKLQITIIATGPQIQLIAGGSCQLGVRCVVRIASATGGIPPYTFKLDTLLSGSPPMGMTFQTDLDFGVLSGTPTIEGNSPLGICVVDSTGASDCRATDFLVGPAVVTTPAIQLSDLNGSYTATYEPTWKSDDFTVLHELFTFSFTITNGRISGDISGTITWVPPDGNAQVSVPFSFEDESAVCSGTWGWKVDISRLVSLTAGLQCRGTGINNSGIVTATKH